MSYPNWIYSMFAFIGFLLVTIPFPWHLEAWNTGTCLYMAWTGIACLIQFINSIVWNGNAYNPAPLAAWCDISTRIMIGTTVAIPAASLCINRRLYHIACVKSVTHSRAEKRRAVMVDLAIGIGIPIAEMILQYITQGHRYDIFEDIGCVPFTYNTLVAVFLVYLPPIVIGIVSAVYCILSIRAFNQSRAQFKEILSNNSNLKPGRFIRLMMLAGTEVACTIPIGCYALYLNINETLNPWISWENVHVGFSRVDQFPALIWKNIPILYSSLEMTRWLVIACAFIFFAYFGFADEAKKNYRSALDSVAKSVGYTSTGSGVFSFNGSKSKTGVSMNGSSGSLPVHIHSHTLRKKDSIDSFSNMSLSLNDVGGALTSEKDLESQNEKCCMPVLAYESIQLPDFGGVLADSNTRSTSPAPSSGSSSSINSPVEPPQPVHTRPTSSMIEISSLRRPSYVDSFVVTESSLVAPRHPIDAPSSVPRGSIDIV
ncbi:Pheromone A receptor domain containing protein [Amanita muscaria]